ncbi:pentatricopeptide repeat (PPR) superfamily protein [Striga asiatica]|uniref:Pentatricopeptide repeat (PPR) superfamily protein n=1 Tax=Striga asiatica TaxID=4170 RepID=A0A5A7P3W8_STRAF|nr:pentatricopeptide repeat (PPR) superfamily protein [Striga asiatica]
MEQEYGVKPTLKHYGCMGIFHYASLIICPPSSDSSQNKAPAALEEEERGLLVWPHKEEFLQVLKANQTLILVGEIGRYRRPDRLATQGLGATASEGAIRYDWCSWPDRQGAGEASILSDL